MPEPDRYDDVRTVSVREAAKLTGLARDTVTAAMRSWTDSRGKTGLCWFRIGRRRLLRLSTLRDWIGQRERESRYAW